MCLSKPFFITLFATIVSLLAIYTIYNNYYTLSAKLDKYIQAYVGTNQFSGTVFVAKNGKILLCKAYGMANIENNVPNTINTKFRLGSITKQFTAMAIMQLQEMGKLNIQDSLSKYIPDYPHGQNITIHNLLTHTSGIPNVTAFPEYKRKQIKPHTLEQLIERFKDRPLDFNPGEKHAYSNSNYILLTYIIEKTSGKKYAEFLKEHIFDPLNMKDSGCDDYRRILKNRAAGYSLINDELANASYIDMSFPAGAGALYSTVEDLYRWDQALYTGKLVSKESLDKMFTPFKDNYGYGLGIETSPHGKVISHSGGIDGFHTVFRRYVDHNACVIVLSNFEFAPVGKIEQNLSRIMFGEKPEYPKMHVAVHVNPIIYDQYVGTYTAKDKDKTFTFVVTKEQAKLFIEFVEQKDKREAYSESETEFFLKGLDIQFSFIKDNNGKVIKFILHEGAHDTSFEKIK